MKRINILLVVACIWMGTVDAKRKLLFIEDWNPTSAYERSVRSDLQEIENNSAVQQVAGAGLKNLESMDMAVLRKAHEYYQWGVTLLEKALKKNFYGGSKIKNSSDRKELKLLLGLYTGIDRIITEAIRLKVMEQVVLEDGLTAALLAKKQQVVQTQKIVEEVAQEIDTLSELEFLVEDLKNRHVAEELEDEAFIQKWQQDSSFVSHLEYLALMEKVASAIEAAQRLHQEYDEEEREAVEAQWNFLYNWHNALQSSQVKPTHTESYV